MKNYFFGLFLLGALFLSAQEAKKPIVVTQYTLANGLTVMLTENHDSPKVFGLVTVKAGGKNDPKNATGIAHYLEHMLFKGTQTMGTIDYEQEKPYLDKISALYEELGKTTDEETRLSIQKQINEASIEAGKFAIANDIDKLLAEIGGTNVNAFTSEDYTVYLNGFPSNQIEKWLEIYSHRFENPVFRLFQSELEAVYEEKNISMDDGFGTMFEELLSKVYKEHPYGQQTILGSVEHLKNPSLQAMYDFYNTYYVANNMALVLSGDFNTAEIMPLIEAKFGTWRSGIVPEFPEYKEADFEKGEKYETKSTPIKVGAMAFRTPENGNPDALKFNLAVQLLSNMEGTGLLDRLADEGEVMGAGLEQLPYNDYGLSLVFYIPKLVGQSLETAEEIVQKRLQQLLNGEFDETYFNAIRLNNQKEIELKWESNESRALEMVESFSQEKTWDEYFKNYEEMSAITKEDVVAVANKYFSKNYFALYSRMGFPKKDKLTKPGFDPVIPTNEQKSAFALHLESIPSAAPTPTYVDFNKDFSKRNLSERFTIYQVPNPFNQVFDLTISYGVGTYKMRNLSQVADFLALIGTDKKSIQELKEAFSALGASFYFYTTETSFVMSIQGIEENLEPTLALVNEFMLGAKADESKMKVLTEDRETNKKMMRAEPSYISRALSQYALYGSESSYKRELTKKELKNLSAQELIDTYKSIFKVETTVSFIGNTDAGTLDNLVTKYLLVQEELAPKQAPLALDRITSPNTIFYIVNDKKAIQSQITFSVEGTPGNKDQYPIISTFNEYFGGGMSSLVFQEIREFRSLAYSAYGYSSQSVVQGKNKQFAGYIGCQGDKTNDAVEAMLELINNMPQKPERMEMIQSALIEKGQTAKPNFRYLPYTLANWDLLGYTSDPNQEFVERYKEMSFADIVNYYEAEMKNKPVIITIVGDAKSFDLKKLKELGKVIMVKESELFVN